MKESEKQVREFLDSAREATLELARHKRQLHMLKDSCQRMTTSYSGIPGSGYADSRDAQLALLADAIEDETKSLARQRRKLREVAAFIDLIDAPDMCRSVLRLRYLEFRRWSEVGRALEQVGVFYSERQIMRLHAKGMECACALWESSAEGA